MAALTMRCLSRREAPVNFGECIHVAALCAGEDHCIDGLVESCRRFQSASHCWKGRGSAAERAGFRRGDIVLSIGGVEIRNPDDFRQAVRRARNDREIALEAARGRARYRLSLPLEE